MESLHPASWSVPVLVAAFLVTAAVIGWLGWKVARYAAQLSERTRFGQAVIGGLLLGAGTSLPEIVVTITGTLAGRPDVAVSNAMGGIVIQSAVLVVADAAYRGRNIEYDSRGSGPMLQGALLVTMLSFTLVAMLSPAVVLLVVHPLSLVLVAAFVLGYLGQHRQRHPHWQRAADEPVAAEADAADEGEAPASVSGPEANQPVSWLVRRVVAYLAVIAVASWVLTESATTLGDVAGLSDTVVAAAAIAFITSLPELVMAVSAVRAGAITLAIADVLGGNLFDATLPALADLIDGPASVFHRVAPETVFLAAAAIAVSGLTLIGMIAPQRRGPFGVGAMSVLVIVAVALTYVRLATW